MNNVRSFDELKKDIIKAINEPLEYGTFMDDSFDVWLKEEHEKVLNEELEMQEKANNTRYKINDNESLIIAIMSTLLLNKSTNNSIKAFIDDSNDDTLLDNEIIIETIDNKRFKIKVDEC
ncbi:hypothetical protein U729_3113 (plasmid) [Clostridium baratii str. Sullivan]|uniref:Phage protein n=1 Tax=Clostridium baratii str. Sullivan TaxID=1415775 RepID=A0A0A7G2U9_9CLOT|nr:hypothetical protein [Clostridium baratii]AIY85301.1 hypothetical protein U729_3113 [Clostridium baratii str. Sullivan]